MIDLGKVLGYSKDCLQSRSLMRAVILDLYPGQTREMNVLLDVYESGVPREIRSAGTITDSQYAAYVQRIVNDYGLQEKYVMEGLDAWIDQCICVGTAAKIHKPEISPNDRANGNSQPRPIKHAPIGAQSVQNVAGSSFDFDLKSVDANSVEIIKFKGFDEKELTVPSTIDQRKVVGVGKDAYKACKSVEKIIIAEGIIYIENGAFAECPMLKEVVLPNTLKRIGSKEESLKTDRFNYSYLMNRGNVGVFAQAAIRHIILPTGLTYLGRETFSGCSSLEEIDLPNGITEIKSRTFSGCSALKKILLPDGLKTIGDYAISGCSKLQNITLPVNVTIIFDHAFYSCKMLRDIQLNEGLLVIDNGVFENCNAMTEITLPSTLNSIGTKVFNLHEYHSPYDRRRNGWFSDNNNPKLTIYCYAGSKGLEYARNEGIPIKDASKR